MENEAVDIKRDSKQTMKQLEYISTAVSCNRRFYDETFSLPGAMLLLLCF